MRIEKNRLVIIGAIALTVVLGVIAFNVIGMLNSPSNPARVNQIAKTIADFELPDGYSAAYGHESDGKSLVIYAEKNGHGRIVIMQSQDGLLNDAALREYLGQLGQDVGQLQQENLLESKGFDLGVASTSRGYAADGTQMVHTVVTFDGNGGSAVMSIENTFDSWNADQVRALLDSFKRTTS